MPPGSRLLCPCRMRTFHVLTYHGIVPLYFATQDVFFERQRRRLFAARPVCQKFLIACTIAWLEKGRGPIRGTSNPARRYQSRPTPVRMPGVMLK